MIYTVAFDVDGCLIDYHDKPRHRVIAILHAMHGAGHYVRVWSGGGKEYAQLWVDRLNLGEYVHEVCSKLDAKTLAVADICFDDENVQLAHLNIRV